MWTKNRLGGEKVKTKKERLLKFLQFAKGEEKSRILAQVVVLDEEVSESA